MASIEVMRLNGKTVVMVLYNGLETIQDLAMESSKHRMQLSSLLWTRVQGHVIVGFKPTPAQWG